MGKRKKNLLKGRLFDAINSAREDGLNKVRPEHALASNDNHETAKPVRNKKKVIVGVVPRLKEIILVKSFKNKHSYHTLIDYNIYPVPKGVAKESTEYAQIINNAVSSFCSLDKKYELWCVIPSLEVVTKFLTIPRVSSSKIYNAVYWAFKNQVPFDEAISIFDFDIVGELNEAGTDKIEILAYSAPLNTINTIKDLFHNAQLPLYGVSVTAFGIQNLLRTKFLVPKSETVCTLFVGNDWSRIDIFSKGNLYLSRDIKTGYQSFVNSIADIIEEKEHNQSDLVQVADDFFTHQLVYAEISNFEENKHFSKILPVTERLVKQIERTFEYFVTASGKNPVGKLYLTGRLCDFNGLMDYLSKRLNVSVEIINCFTESEFEQKPILQLKSVADIYLPAFGASCSNRAYTPNFIHTFKEKESVRKAKKIDIAFLSIACLVILLLFGAMFWQKHQVNAKKIIAGTIQEQIKNMGTPVTRDMIVKKNNQILQYQKKVQDTADYFSSIAAASEIFRLTSGNVHLVDMTIINSKTDDKPIRSLSVKGYIFENKLLLDSALAGYRETLNSSLLFNEIVVSNKMFKIFNDKDAIYFEMEMDIMQGFKNA